MPTAPIFAYLHLCMFASYFVMISLPKGCSAKPANLKC